MTKNILEENVLEKLQSFINKYGSEGFVEALETYDALHRVYIYKTKYLIKRIPIDTINFIEIYGHDIIIHTTEGNFKKYGTIKNEYNLLKNLGFVKCNQSFLIPVNKIVEIKDKSVRLSTGEEFKLSRNCANEVINEYIRSVPKLV